MVNQVFLWAKNLLQFLKFENKCRKQVAPIFNNMKKCLIFGGNGFMGFEAVLHLLKSTAEDQFEFTLLNRGKSCKAWGKKKLLPCTVRTFTVNRNKPLSQNTDLVQYVNSVDLFDTVVDFSGFKPFAVEQSIELLQGKVGMYVYISTDSVYEVCEMNHDGKPSKESSAIRPRSESKRTYLNKRDKYGHRKLACEEALQKQRAEGGFPCVVLRLPDVIGPRDSTDRWYQYQLWLKLSNALGIPVFIPKCIETQEISLVYAADVARVIGQLVQDGSLRSRVADEAFNLAFTDCPSLTVKDLLVIMQKCLSLGNVTYQFRDRDVPQIFPSVNKGPINTAKAQGMLSWSPTPSVVAFEETIKFYEESQVSQKYTLEMWESASALMDDLKDIFDATTCAKIKVKFVEWLGESN